MTKIDLHHPRDVIQVLFAVGIIVFLSVFFSDQELHQIVLGSTAETPTQSTTTILPIGDATIASSAPDSAYGMETTLILFHSGSLDTGRILMAFDLSSTIPAGAIIDSANLNIYLESGTADGDITITATNLTSPWTESEVTWNTKPALGAITNDNIVAFTSGLKQLDITEVVQSWQSGEQHGLALTAAEGYAIYNYTFTSKEGSVNKPELEVTYHLPPPSEYIFSGYAYLGHPVDSDRPLEGVRLELFGDQNDWPNNGDPNDDPGVLLDSAISEPDGSFSLQWEEESFPYFHILAFSPEGYFSDQVIIEPPGIAKLPYAVTYADPGRGTYGGISFYNLDVPKWCMPYVINGDFESENFEPWGSFGDVDISPGIEGGSAASLGGTIGGVGEIWQVVTVPGEPEAAVLTFWWKAEAAIEKPMDNLKVIIQSQGEDNLMLWLPAVDTLGSWQYIALDLQSYMGEQISITFNGQTNGDFPTTFSVDDIQLFACGGTLGDLVISDFWSEGNQICYQLHNIGNTAVTTPFSVVLERVEVVQLAEDIIDPPLDPDQRWSGCFELDWNCAAPADTLMVMVDPQSDIPEWNNSNNWREETWRCDDTPPTLVSGPSVVNLTDNSAVVEWQTDEPGDSQVLYSNNSRELNMESYQSAMVKNHSVQLSGLNPNTIYGFMITSEDESMNRSSGTTGTFRTLAVDDEQDPSISLQDPSQWTDNVILVADAFDNSQVKKVVFCLEEPDQTGGASESESIGVTSDTFCQTGIRLWTDYSAPFQVSIDTTAFENGDYTILAKAYDPSNRSAVAQIDAQIANPIDLDAPIVSINYPNEGQSISGVIQVSAELSDPNGLSYAYFWVNGEFEEFRPLPDNPENITLNFELDTTSITMTNTVLAVEAYDTHFNNALGIRNVIIDSSSPTSQPQLTVTQHNVTRQDNAIVVELTVKNIGLGTAKQIEIIDSLRSFQPISDTVTNPNLITYTSRFQANQKKWFLEIVDSEVLPPGESRTYTYRAIPVMVYPNPTTPAVGDEIYLTYQDSIGTKFNLQNNFPVQKTTQQQTIYQAWSAALKQASYLLVTHPERLFSLDADHNPTDDLLSAMAELAFYKEGALGYMYVYDHNVLKSLIEPKLLNSNYPLSDNWADRLNPDFHKLLTGALLIVGEVEIIPAWEQDGFSINWGPVPYSDQPYADIGGSPAPDILVGRIVGDDPSILIKPIQASIGVFTGDPNYDFGQSNAVTVSGPGLGSFVQDINDLSLILADQGYLIAKIHTKDFFKIGSFPISHYSQDDLTTGELILSNPGEEIVILDNNTEIVKIYDKSGSVLDSFPISLSMGSSWEGDQIVVANQHLIATDINGDRILIYDSTGNLLSSFPFSIDPGDHLDTGDLDLDGSEEIVIADIDAGKVIYYDESGLLSNQQVTFNLEAKDLFAVGDVIGDNKAEIVLGDYSTGELIVFSASGNQLTTFQLTDKKLNGKSLNAFEYYDTNPDTNWNEGGSILAIGQLYPYPSGSDSLKKEILLAPAFNAQHLFVFWWFPKESQLEEAPPVPWDFERGEDISIGDLGIINGRLQDEIIVTDSSGYLRQLDTLNWWTRWNQDIPVRIQDSDLIMLSGHGNTDGCCGISSYSTTFPLDFTGHNPVAMGISCLTGNYQDRDDPNNLPDRILDSGAAVYIGSTQDSNGYQNREAAKWIASHWKYGESIGKVFTELERSYWKGSITDDWYFWSYEYNLYGDPKFGAQTTAQTSFASIKLENSTISINIPDYIVTRSNDLDWVEIPGGRMWTEAGQLWLPYYTTLVEIPAGQAVEDVELVERGIPTTQTGLNLPMVPIAIPACDCQPETYSGPVEDWYPNQIFDWKVLHNPDGSSTLAISTFPFQYNPLTAVSRFYPSYTFEIITQSTGVQITGLGTDKPSYDLEDPVQIEIEVKNLGETQDVIVRALIKQAGSEDEIAGLTLTVLDGLVGPAGITLEWDSTGIDPGTYQVQVALQPLGGEWTMSLETQRFDLGIVNATNSYKIFLPMIQK